MSQRHTIPPLPSPLVAHATKDQLRVSLPEGPSASFLRVSLPSLTLRAIADVLARAEQVSPRQVFVSYSRSSAEARDALRNAGISFAGDDGHVFVRAPGLLVERAELARPRSAERWGLDAAEESSVRNPFAKRSSRVPRWLLLHPAESFSPGKLAKATGLNPAAVSRVVRALEDAALVHPADPQPTTRRRNVHVKRPGDLLAAWLPLWERRRIRRLHWDIGARDADEAVSLLSQAMEGGTDGWAIGGLAGAATLRRAVEPAEVLVWTTAESLEALGQALQPVAARGGRGAVRLAIAPDPWTLGLAHPSGGVPIADPVQLWLDCSSEGERALEAADAVADVAGWS